MHKTFREACYKVWNNNIYTFLNALKLLYAALFLPQEGIHEILRVYIVEFTIHWLIKNLNFLPFRRQSRSSFSLLCYQILRYPLAFR
ncbi:hypothetical protein NEOC65_002477 [Neochlamydia sp. AcF65]|nr:hypothetical protein [Neochlamydia sp. AcF65]MBS4169640.1 hypothetical protein [Neochlamydia sp. AcF95]NGY95456.1 hypothetical protein [Neochlamydia sp. AcF84]